MIIISNLHSGTKLSGSLRPCVQYLIQTVESTKQNYRIAACVFPLLIVEGKIFQYTFIAI